MKSKTKKKSNYHLHQNLGYLLTVCRRAARGLVSFTLLIALLQLAINLTQLYLAPIILQRVEQNAPLSTVLGTIGGFTLTLALCTAAYHWLNTGKDIFANRLYQHIMTELNHKACTTSYPNTLETAFLQTQQLALNNMLGNGLDTPPCAMMRELGSLLTALLGFAVYLTVLSDLDPLLLGVTVLTAAVSFLLSLYFNRWSEKHHEELQALANEIYYPVDAAMHHSEMAKDIRLFRMKPWLLSLLDGAMEKMKHLYRNRELWFFLSKFIDILLTLARNGIAYVYLLRMVLESGLPASQFLLYFSAVTGFTQWVTAILNGIIALHRESVKLSVVRECLDWKEPFRFEADGSPVPRPANGTYELKLEHVSYRYAGSDKDTITDMNLTVPFGEKLAIVGLNGAGKTTLVKLLCGLLDPTEGRVLLNGEDIRQYDRRDYYTLFTSVFQEFSVLQDTLAVNIAQTEADIDFPRVQECIRRAGFSEAVEKLPDGLNTHLSKAICDDGITLSGGQEQRLMLARALYKNAPILLLDEPTAALDPIAENDMYLRYNEIAEGRTSIYISHRLASTRFCDRVLFLKDGAIAEEGTHEELLARKGGYAALFETQSQYYQEGGEENEEA